MDVGKKIHDLRIAKNMTLEELGSKVGVGKSTVRKWETGAISNMRRDKIDKIANALGVPAVWLMGWDNYLPDGQEFNIRIGLEDDEDLYKLKTDEYALIELFRRIPDGDKQMILGMIRAALSSKGLL